MADYIEISEAQTNPFAPVTSELLKQLRDNPIAISEGAPDAPKVQGLALGGIFVAKESSVFTLGGAVILTVTDLDDVKTIMALGRVETSTDGSPRVEYQTSVDNGDTWGSGVVLTGGTNSSSSEVIELGSDINAIRFLGIQVGPGSSSGSATVLIIEGKEL